jgi:hypothetical protein
MKSITDITLKTPHAITNSNADIDRLSLTALLYLIFPTILFFIEWFRPIFGFALATLAIVGLGYIYKLCKVDWGTVSLGRLAIVIGVAIIWSSLGGAGHLFYANAYDWVVRDAVLRDLVVSNGPPLYGKLDEFSLIMRAPVGYYMPAAIFGKMFGIAFADFFLWLWTIIGVGIFLSLLPISNLSWFRFLSGILIVVFFSGMDIVGLLVTGQPLPSMTDHIEWWARIFQYPSNTALLFWVPNHAIPGWISGALLFRHWRNPSFLSFSPMMLASLPLWSPFAFIGVAPLMLLPAALAIRDGYWSHLRMVFILPAVGMLLIVIRYLTLDAQNIPLQWVIPDTSFFFQYVLFVALECGILSFILWRIQPSLPLLISIVFLVLLPFLKLGPGNDLVMRASIPCLTIICAIAVQSFDINAYTKNRRVYLSLIVVLILGAPTALNEISRSISFDSWKPNIDKSLCAINQGRMGVHYVARLNQPGLQWLMKDPAENKLLNCS